MAKKLVLKAAPKPPDKSPDGADHVFTDDNGLAHYKDGSLWAPDEDDDEEEGEDLDADNSDDDDEPEEEDTAPDDGNGDNNDNGIDTDDDGSEGDVVEEAKDESAESAEDEADEAEDGQEDEDEEQKVESKPVKMSKRLSDDELPMVGLDVLRLSTALVEKMTDIFSNTDLSKRDDEYEAAMLGFNRAMDRAAIENWLTGNSVSKHDDDKTVTEAVEAITKVYENVVESVGGVPVSKSETETDIYKGLSPEVAEIVKRSEQVIEERETEKWTGIAKNFKNIPGDPAVLGSALRALHGADAEKYEVVRAALAGSDAALTDGEVFKSIGRPGADSQTADITKRAEELVSKGEHKTVEQAAVALMAANPGEFYSPTNAR
jgi:hypothetical protein